jgi:hypothetical protein
MQNLIIIVAILLSKLLQSLSLREFNTFFQTLNRSEDILRACKGFELFSSERGLLTAFA